MLAAAVVAGCGGDDGGGAPSTRAGYIERGDALCRAINRDYAERFDVEFEEIGRQFEESQDYERFYARYRALLEKEADRSERHIDDYAALEPPAGSEDFHDRIVRDLREQQALLRDMAAAYEGPEPDLDRAERLLERIEANDRRLQRVLRDYGFEDCALAAGD